MHWIDWLVLILTLAGITLYGIWKTKGSNSADDYLRGNQQTPWWVIGLSIMATQASAITFISTPGMGYESGLGFVQFYFGLPIAMVIIAVAFVPVYHRLKVVTAFEFLENRFDLKTRLLTAFLFLLQRGLAAGITIYAPSIILSKILGIPLYVNILIIGILVILYTVSGGTEAVTQTHKQQMAVIFIGLFVAMIWILKLLLEDTSVHQIFQLARWQNKLNVVDTRFRLDTKYNLWSGLIAGTFLMLSYFGTDQSQVQRYLSGKSLKEIRTGLYFNAVLKIPMQLFILFLGVLVFIFYQFNQPPVHFDQLAIQHLEKSEFNDQFQKLKQSKTEVFNARKEILNSSDESSESELNQLNKKELELNREIEDLLEKSKYQSPVKKQSDYVFITFVLNYWPVGLIGLLMAVIFSAAMSSTAAELNALGTTSLVDFHQRLGGKSSISAGRWYTAIWGIIAIVFALIAQFMNNLVEAVNVLGSLFYGTVLGIFLVALYFKNIKGTPVVWGAFVGELTVLILFFFDKQIVELTGIRIEFLWYNLIGCLLVIGVSLLIQKLFYSRVQLR
ncbi:MAG: sodium:solute symporter [Bacteroidetes bacterium]|nr:sodium:solute symporter [Bacteroidota bacterium]